MANGFKRFLDTGGLSLDEIREKINKMALELAVDIVDGATQLMPREIRSKAKQMVRDLGNKSSSSEYKAEKIPPRAQQDKNSDAGFKVTKVIHESGVVHTDIFDDESDPAENFNDKLKDAADDNGNLHYGLLPENTSDPEKILIVNEQNVVTAYPHEAIIGEQSEQDEFMAEKIAQMRKLEEVSHNGYIVKRCVEITMVRQGEFMKDVEDDYLHSAFCGIPRPIYAAMSRSQLRTYFTWRTGWRRGLHSKTDKPYILLYCYEVLNKIGFDSSTAAFRELLLIWNELRDDALYLNDFLPRWIKDFYAFNRIDDPLPEFPEEHNGTDVCSEILSGNYKNKLDYLADNSSYNIRCSVFVNAGNKPYLNGACEAALLALDAHFKKFGVELSGLICGKMRKEFSWSPFGGAPVDLDRMDGFEPLKISEPECYCKKRGEPALEVFEFAPSKDFIGYVLKCVEARLRKRMAFSHRLSPNISMIKNELANRGKLQSAVSDKAFETLISDAVDLYCCRNNIGAPRKIDDSAVNYSARKVEIDVSKLGEIREQAERNTKLLIVPDEDLSEDTVWQSSEKVAEDEFSAAVADASETEEVSENSGDGGSIGVLTPDKFVITTQENVVNGNIIKSGAVDGLPEEWREFALKLRPHHIPS
ncbi:MAG: TerB N-terminal domain-containing protein, partial [Oscillospiraceae bacterium]|nr:TerB N-terminal domain-containing protein [Oscillospiraceae bacterium]